MRFQTQLFFLTVPTLAKGIMQLIRMTKPKNVMFVHGEAAKVALCSSILNIKGTTISPHKQTNKWHFIYKEVLLRIFAPLFRCANRGGHWAGSPNSEIFDPTQIHDVEPKTKTFKKIEPKTHRLRFWYLDPKPSPNPELWVWAGFLPVWVKLNLSL